MRKVIVVNIMSLDGYFEGPGANVMALPMDEAFDLHNREHMEAASTVLLGRTSFQGFSSYWPGIADAPEDPENRALSEENRALSRGWNTTDKVVVTDSYTPPEDNPWFSTTSVVGRDEVADWIAEHREGDGGNITVFGSHTMWNGLLADGLVDELHLMVGPVVLGGGTPIFTGPTDGLTLLDVRRFEGSGNVVMKYAAR